MRSAASILAALISLTGCAPLGPAGWAVVQEGPHAIEAGVTATRQGTRLVLTLTTLDGGADGCGDPSISGVERINDTMVVRVTRAPLGAQCLVTGNTTFVIEVDDRLGAGAVHATSDDRTCSGPGCAGRVVDIGG